MPKLEQDIIDETIMAEAARWVVQLSREDVSAAHKAEFQAWLTEDSRHPVALEANQAAWNKLDELSSLLDVHGSAIPQTLTNKVNLVRRARIRQKTSLLAKWVTVAAACGLFLLVGSVLPELYSMGKAAIEAQQDKSGLAEYRTMIGERREVVLSDGSVLLLNADTSVTTALTTHERRVVLHSGEVYFDVARDPERPFNVMVGGATVTAVGTAYNVRYRRGPPTVTVFEGEVEVRYRLSEAVAPNGSDVHRVREGQVVGYEAADVTVRNVSSEALARTLAWQEGRLYFDSEPLGNIVAEINHYVPQRIVVTEERIESYLGGGVFFVDNVDSILRALELSWPVRIVRSQDVILITPTESP